MSEKITGKAREIVDYLMGDNIDRNLIWDLSLHKKVKPRSMDSNRYFHKLCDELRQKLGISMTHCKNNLITSYGQIQYISDGEPMIYKTNAPVEYMREFEPVHTKCVKITEENGKPVFFYMIYRGSRTYSTDEMSKLIKGTISECELQGIKTASPDELAHMQELWKAKYERMNNVQDEGEIE